jgi:hypothetical protein
MNRLVRTPQSFVRAHQISRVRLNLFVEGGIDSYFYGQICQQVLPGRFEYQLWPSTVLGAAGAGKSHVLKTFDSLRRRKLLVMDFKGQRKASIFFVDKDADDLRRTIKRSPLSFIRNIMKSRIISIGSGSSSRR